MSIETENSETTSNIVQPGALNRRSILLGSTTLAAASALGGTAPTQVAQAQQQPAPTGRPPNILIIWGDDIGYWNISAYNQGMMGYKTPNIDRIAREGACSPTGTGSKAAPPAARAFITGQVGFRTGMLKVGLPGAKEGLQARDVTIAELLKAQGLQDRPVREEPPRRPRRASAHGARLR